MKRIVMSAVLNSVLLLLPSAFAQTQPLTWPAAWSDARPGEAKSGGTFRDYSPINQSFNTFTDSQWVLGSFLSNSAGLLKRDPTSGQLVPNMALDMPAVSADGLTYTFKIRPGLKFSDGTPITAEDWVTTARIYADKDLNSSQRSYFFVEDKPIVFRAVDPLTLEAKLPAPTAWGAANLSFSPWPAHIFGPVYEKEGAAGIRKMWGQDAKPGEVVSPGMWMLAQNDNKAGGHVVFKKNPYWSEWNRDSEGKALPYLDAVDVSILPENVRPIEAFLAGQVDRSYPTSAKDLKAVEDAVAGGKLNATLLKNIGVINTQSYLTFNYTKASDPARQALFRDPKFRQAISRIINRQKMLDDVLGGLGQVSHSGIPLLYPAYIPNDLPKYSYDLAAAGQQLAELGFKSKDADGYLTGADGKRLEFEVLTYDTPDLRKMVDILTADAKTAGVKVNGRFLTYADTQKVIKSASTDRAFDAFLFYDGGNDPTWPFPDFLMLCSGQERMYNLSGKCLTDDEKKVEALYWQGAREGDLQKRLAIGHELHRVLAEQLALIPVLGYAYNVAYDNRLGGMLPKNSITPLVRERWLGLTFIK